MVRLSVTYKIVVSQIYDYRFYFRKQNYSGYRPNIKKNLTRSVRSCVVTVVTDCVFRQGRHSCLEHKNKHNDRKHC